MLTWIFSVILFPVQYALNCDGGQRREGKYEGVKCPACEKETRQDNETRAKMQKQTNSGLKFDVKPSKASQARISKPEVTKAYTKHAVTIMNRGKVPTSSNYYYNFHKSTVW